MADASSPEISIIVPSHNRCDLLRQVLDALSAQRPGTPAFEVIVVADGCQDGTQAMLASHAVPYPLHMLEQPGVGPSRARNAGAKRAGADLLLFLDDDVIPTPGLVAAHWDIHRVRPGGAVLGPYPPAPHASGDRFRISARRWWDAHFAELARPGHRFTYIDLLTGNLSLARALWDAVGGLDPQFAHAREDLELGVRLIKHGAPLHYAADAIGWHQEYLTTSPRSALRRAKEEGRSDALMTIKHPDMAPALKAARQLRRKGRAKAIKYAIIRRTGFIDRPLMAAGPGLLTMVERLGLVSARRRLEHILREYCYARGEIEGLGPRWSSFIAEPMPRIPPPEIDIDLSHGLDAAERRLTEFRPASARILHGGTEICVLPWAPIAERWSGHHLRPHLARHATRAMIPYLAAQAEGGEAENWASLDALPMIGVKDFWAQLFEAQRQWKRPA